MNSKNMCSVWRVGKALTATRQYYISWTRLDRIDEIQEFYIRINNDKEIINLALKIKISQYFKKLNGDWKVPKGNK